MPRDVRRKFFRCNIEETRQNSSVQNYDIHHSSSMVNDPVDRLIHLSCQTNQPLDISSFFLYLVFCLGVTDLFPGGGGGANYILKNKHLNTH